MPQSEKLQYYQQVSRANLTVLVESVWHLMTSAICGVNASDCCMKLVPNGSWEKMYQGCYQAKMDGFSDEFSGTWMKWGVMYSGSVFQPMQLEPSFGVSVSQLWPRPIASDSVAWQKNCKANPRSSIVKSWGGCKARPEYLQFFVARSERDPSGGLPRNDDGVPGALDRLKAIGNAVVPQQFYPIFQAIADVERLAEDGKT